MNCYSDVFTGDTWQQFSADGLRVTAFSGGMSKQAATVSEGDRFLCYLKGTFSFVGALEAVSRSYTSDQPIWLRDSFPIRVDVRPIVTLPATNGLPLVELEGRVSFFSTGQHLSSVPARFQGSPRPMSFADGEVLLRAMLAREDGVRGGVLAENAAPAATEVTPTVVRAHAEIQGLLADLGLRMGCSVWTPRNDRPAIARARPGMDTASLLADLPILFTGHAQTTVRNIDVLWLRSNTVIAAFEVENTTSIYSGLLRMSDLAAELPNIRFPLYIVAPDERREAVRNEIMRPTFRGLAEASEPMAKYVSFDKLRGLEGPIGDTARYVQPKIIESIAERFTD